MNAANKRRAKCIDSALRKLYDPDDTTRRSATWAQVVDALTDLRHFCDAQKPMLDFADLDRIAHEHHRAERQGD